MAVLKVRGVVLGESMPTDLDIGRGLKVIPLSTEPIRNYSKVHIDPSDFINSEEAIVGVFDFLGFKRFMALPNLFEIASELIGLSDLVKSCGEDHKKSFKLMIKPVIYRPKRFR